MQNQKLHVKKIQERERERERVVFVLRQSEVKQRVEMSHTYVGAASTGTVWAAVKELPVPPTRLYSGRNLGIQNKTSLRNNQGLMMSKILVNTSLPLPPPILPSLSYLHAYIVADPVTTT